jgi:hypothetical protein
MPELELIMAPRTRLATALLATPSARERAIAVRHEADEQWAAETWPGLTTVRTDAELPFATHYDRIVVHATALGRMTPTAHSTLGHDAAALVRDIDFLERLVQSQGSELHIVFVSTVLALSPRRERQYYAGWKCVAEYELVRRFQQVPRVTVSVVYPGRITEERTARSPKSALYTPYSALARRIIAIGSDPTAVRQVVGADARAWLAARGLKTMSGAVMSQKVPAESLD